MFNCLFREINNFQNKKYLFVFFLVLFWFANSNPKGDLTKQTPIEIIVKLNGDSSKPYMFEPNFLKFETGKLYKLKLINLSRSKHYFTSIKFSNSIFTRKIQVSHNEETIAEIKGDISEVEVFPSHELEWWFVPVKTGIFDDLQCSIIDNKSKKSHAQLGMVGRIVVE